MHLGSLAAGIPSSHEKPAGCREACAARGCAGLRCWGQGLLGLSLHSAFPVVDAATQHGRGERMRLADSFCSGKGRGCQQAELDAGSFSSLPPADSGIPGQYSFAGGPESSKCLCLWVTLQPQPPGPVGPLMVSRPDGGWAGCSFASFKQRFGKGL